MSFDERCGCFGCTTQKIKESTDSTPIDTQRIIESLFKNESWIKEREKEASQKGMEIEPPIYQAFNFLKSIEAELGKLDPDKSEIYAKLELIDLISFDNAKRVDETLDKKAFLGGRSRISNKDQIKAYEKKLTNQKNSDSTT